MTARKIAPKDVIPTLSQHMLVDGYHTVVDLDRSHGTFLRDARDGREFLDFFSFFASNPLGMNHPDMTDPAFLDRLGRTAVNKVSNSDFYTDVLAEFVSTVDRVARPDSMRWFFFVSGGALSVENGLKAAFDWKVRRNLRKGLPDDIGQEVLHLQHAFHGRSGYTLSLTNTDPRKTMYFPKFDWPRIPSPAMRFPMTDDEAIRVEADEAQALERARAYFEERPDRIAAILLEPIQAEGGDRHFRSSFLQGLRLLADEFDALLVFDEVQTGVGMTGRFWAYEHFGVEPDILVFAKKMQVGGIMAGPRLDEEPENVFHVPSRINSTWGAHIVDMLRATRILEVIERDSLVASAAVMGKRLLDGLHQLERVHPGLVSNVRGRGLMAAIDLPDGSTRDAAIQGCLEADLLVPACGPQSLRFRPPLTVSGDEIDLALERVDAALKKVEDKRAPALSE